VDDPLSKRKSPSLQNDLLLRPTVWRHLLRAVRRARQRLLDSGPLLKYRRWWLNDTRTAPFLEAIRRMGDKVKVPYRTRNDACGTKEFYKRYRDEDSDEAVLLEPFLTYSGSGYHAGGPRGSGAGAGSARYTRVLRECHRVMHDVRPVVTDWDWTKVVARLGPGDFAYIDPPYLNSNTRTYSEDDIDHERLVWILKRAKFRWILSQYLHPVYLLGLGDPSWSKDMGLFVAAGHETRTERIWSNSTVSRNAASLRPAYATYRRNPGELAEKAETF
jgi:hypothetical protein